MRNILLLILLITLHLSVVAAEFSMPFGLATVPDAKLAISDVFDSPSGDREESIARFATKASRKDVINFYRQALEKKGFKVYSSSDTAKFSMIAAKRNDDRITVYFKNNSDWVEADESEISINAAYNKRDYGN